VAVAKRRNITNANKRRIVLAAAACTKPGEIGALMRRAGAKARYSVVALGGIRGLSGFAGV
jgi:hypothetical protein